MTEGNRIPSVGDVVLIKDQVGIVRYVGPLHMDKEINIGLEMKGEPLKNGHDGTLDNNKYFHATAGHGIFTKRIDRVIPPEELLEKVASLYEMIKDEKQSGDKREVTKEELKNRYFVDKKRYEELSRKYESLQLAYENLMEKCENLEFQNQTLRTQSSHKVDDLSKLHDKVNSWASRFGMRRPTLSSLDDNTIREINTLIQTKEDHKTHRSYRSIDNNNLFTADDITQPPEKLLITDRPPHGVISRKGERGSRTIEEHDLPQKRQGRETMVLDDVDVNDIHESDPAMSTVRIARDSMEVSSATIQTQVLLDAPDMEEEANQYTADKNSQVNGKPKARVSVKLAEMQNIDTTVVAEVSQNNPSMSTHRAKESKILDNIGPKDIDVASEEQIYNDNDNDNDNDNRNHNYNNNNNNNNNNKNGDAKHGRTPSDVAIDNMGSHWEDGLAFNGLTDPRQSSNDISINSNATSIYKPHKKKSWTMPKTNNADNFMTEKDLNDLAMEESEEEEEEKKDNLKAPVNLKNKNNSSTHDKNKSSIDILNTPDIFGETVSLSVSDTKNGSKPQNEAATSNFDVAGTKKRGSFKASNNDEDDADSVSKHQKGLSVNSTISETNYFNQVD